MQQVQSLNGFVIQPRGRDVTKDFQIEISSDGTTWTSLGTYTFANNGKEQKFILSEQASCRYFKITCLNGYSSSPYTSISEIYAYRNK